MHRFSHCVWDLQNFVLKLHVVQIKLYHVQSKLCAVENGQNCWGRLRPRPSYKKVGCCDPYCLPESERYMRHPCPSYRKKKRSSTPYIAPEIIFNVLVFLPADVLYNVMRYVMSVESGTI